MKSYLFSFIFLFFSLSLLAQKAEKLSFKCSDKTYSFTGYMIGDPKPKTELKDVYYYTLNTEKAEFYHLKYSDDAGNPLFYIQKITVLLIPELKELSYDKEENSFYAINDYGGPENIVEEICNCFSGNNFTSEFNRFVQNKDFVMNENQSDAFKKILHGIKPYVDELEMLLED